MRRNRPRAADPARRTCRRPKQFALPRRARLDARRRARAILRKRAGADRAAGDDLRSHAGLESCQPARRAAFGDGRPVECGARPARTEYAVGAEGNLATAILVANGAVLAWWEHHARTNIVAALPGQGDFNELWPDDRFDLVWLLDAEGDAYVFSHATQGLLDGDQGMG